MTGPRLRMSSRRSAPLRRLQVTALSQHHLSHHQKPESGTAKELYAWDATYREL